VTKYKGGNIMAEDITKTADVAVMPGGWAGVRAECCKRFRGAKGIMLH